MLCGLLFAPHKSTQVDESSRGLVTSYLKHGIESITDWGLKYSLGQVCSLEYLLKKTVDKLPLDEGKLLKSLSTAESRQRYRMNNLWKQKYFRMFENLGALAERFVLYIKSLSTKDREWFSRLWYKHRFNLVTGYDSLVQRLKGLTSVIKVMGSYELEHWWHFVGLETMVYYVEPDAEIAKLDSWVSGYGGVRTDPMYYPLFKQHMHKVVVSGKNSLNKPLLSLQEFISKRGLWATQGSSSEKSRLFISGKRARKTKINYALSYTTDEILKIVHGYETGDHTLVYNVVKKLERNKARAVILADNIIGYLCQSYLSYYLEQCMNLDNSSPLCMSGLMRIKMWTGQREELKRRSSVGVPLDQAAFDHNVNQDEISIGFTELCSHAQNLVSGTTVAGDVSLCSKLIMDTFVNHRIQIVVTTAEKTYKHEHGILSGMRWTALMDTLINYSQVHTLQDIVDEMVLPCVWHQTNCNGDDVMTGSNSVLHARCLVLSMLDNGMDPSAGKWSIQAGLHKYNEFLRTVVTGSGFYQYPARSIGALFESNPLSSGVSDGMERVAQIASQYCTVSQRFNSSAEQYLYSIMMEDISHACSVSRVDVKRYLHTPSALGGLGLSPIMYFDTLELISDEKLTEKDYTLSGSYGLDDYARNVKPEYSNYFKTAVLKQFLEMDTFQKIKIHVRSPHSRISTKRFEVNVNISVKAKRIIDACLETIVTGIDSDWLIHDAGSIFALKFKDVDQVVVSTLIEIICRNYTGKECVSRLRELVDDSSLSRFDWMVKHTSKKAFFNIIKGRWESSAGYSFKVPTNVLGLVFKTVRNKALSQLNCQKWTTSVLSQVQLECELLTKALFESKYSHKLCLP